MKFDPWTFVGYLVALALVTLGLLLILCEKQPTE